MTDNQDEKTSLPEFDIVEDDNAPLGEKPKRKRKAVIASDVPWRWVIPAFAIGIGIALIGVIISSLSKPVTGVMFADPTPLALTPSLAAPVSGGRIEDIVWHGNQMFVAHSNPAQLVRFDQMQWKEEITPFTFDNIDGDEYLAMAVHPSGDSLIAIETSLSYDTNAGDLFASSYLHYWKFTPSQDGSLGGSTIAHSDTTTANGNPALPYLDTAITYSPNGSLLATGAGGATKGDGNIYVWDANGILNNTRTQPLAKLWASATGTVELAFTEDGNHLTAIARTDEAGMSNCIDCSNIMIYDVRDPAQAFPLWEVQRAPHFNSEAAEKADISENGHYLAIPQLEDPYNVTGIEIWELPSMKQVGIIPIDSQGEMSVIEDIDLSSSGHTITFIHRMNQDINLHVATWNMPNTTFEHVFTYTTPLDPLYVGRYFLHIAEEGFVYYVSAPYNVLMRIDLRTGEQIQMMQV